MTTNQSAYIDLDEAALYLGCDKRTVRRMISRGDLPGFKYGSRMLRVRREDIDSLILAGRIPTAEPR